MNRSARRSLRIGIAGLVLSVAAAFSPVANLLPEGDSKDVTVDYSQLWEG